MKCLLFQRRVHARLSAVVSLDTHGPLYTRHPATQKVHVHALSVI